MSGLKYHNLYMCIIAQTCLYCKLLQNAAIFFFDFVSLCSDLMATGNPFQTVAMSARRVPDDFCGGAFISPIPRNIKTTKEALSAASTLLPAERVAGRRRQLARVTYPECGTLS
jgi:hypothetical protein